MRYYKFNNNKLILPLEYEFITDDNISIEDITACFKKTYKPSLFQSVEEVTKDEIDVTWAMRLIKVNNEIKYA